VQAAKRLGVTLVGFLRDDRANVYSHTKRITVDS
jgi:formate dehydrogenase assembly factor FdhD